MLQVSQILGGAKAVRRGKKPAASLDTELQKAVTQNLMCNPLAWSMSAKASSSGMKP